MKNTDRLLLTIIGSLMICTYLHSQSNLLWPHLNDEKNPTQQQALESKPAKKVPKPEVHFNLPGGYYQESLKIELSCPGSKIFYTLDGSRPDKTSKVFSKPIHIQKSTVLRAIAYKNGRKSNYLGQTYLINEPVSNIATVSIGIDPDVLFDPENGLYMKGPNTIDSLWKLDGANFWSRKEVKAHVEIFENNGNQVFSSQIGLRLFGGISRLFPQKSLTIVARDRYGKKRIRHKLFGKGHPDKYKFLVLRNSGSDWGKSHFRDALMTGLLSEWDLETQAYRPSHVFLNGQYWGIYNIREKVNRYFLEDYFDIDKDSLDLLEHKMSLKRGSSGHYRNLIAFLNEHSLANKANYEYVKSLMDVDNFMQYQIAQIFIDNKDAGGNIKFWRPQKNNGKWRWILYDTDWGFGLHDAHAFRSNSLEFHTKPDGPSWPNPPWSTFILRKLMENDDFRLSFINRMMDHLNTTFKSKRVIQHIDKKASVLHPEVKRHFQRWRLSEDTWVRQINIMKRFAEKRPTYLKKHLREFFSLKSLETVNISANKGGTARLNDYVQIDEESKFTGEYFCDLPISVTALPKYGYRFSHWRGIKGDAAMTPSINLRLLKGKALDIEAVFEPFRHPLDGLVFINEICVKNKNSGDWIELCNFSKEKVCLNGWFLRDKKNEYILPLGCIEPNGYAILAEDTSAFRSTFGHSKYLIGSLPFGLNKKKESLALYANDRSSVDTISYQFDEQTSPFTWALINPNLDNHVAANWELVPGNGTPGLNNPAYMLAKIREQQQKWLKLGSTLGLLLVGLALYFANRRKKRLTNRVL